MDVDEDVVVLESAKGAEVMTDDLNNVISLHDFRSRKLIKGERDLGLCEAFAPKTQAFVKNKRAQEAEVAKIYQKEEEIKMKIKRIQESIQRINQLMEELRKKG